MSRGIDKLASELQKAITEGNNGKKTGYDTIAEVTRIEGDDVWVRIPGGYDETPATKASNAKVGDEVLVRVAGHRAWILGNKSDPSVGEVQLNIVGDIADMAVRSAGKAQESAEDAHKFAGQAYEYASDAKEQAISANHSANSALTQLSVVEDVVGVLQWIQEHGSYTVTTDTEVVEGTVYFIYDPETEDYEPIAEPDPDKNPHEEGWYVLDISDAQSDFIMAHLAVTTRGLWVLPSGKGSGTTPASGETQADSDARQGNNYKVLLSSDGMYVYDGIGALVAKYGESISFSSLRPQYIGNNNTYIAFDPSNGGSITIGGGSRVTIGTGKTLDQVLTDLDVSVTQTASGADITVNGETVSIANGATGATGATGPEAVVTIYPDAIEWDAGTATLAVVLRVDGEVVPPNSFSWTQGPTGEVVGTDHTLNVTDLSTVYNCTVTWDDEEAMASQTGSIDFTSLYSNKDYTEAKLETKVNAVATDGGVSLISNINAIADRINLIAQQIRFSDTNQSSVFEILSTYMNQLVIDTSVPSITIGDKGLFAVVITDDEMQFFQNNVKVAYLNSAALHVENRIAFADFQFLKRANGHFTLKFIDQV